LISNGTSVLAIVLAIDLAILRSELAEHPGLPNVSLAAAKAVVEKWIALTEHFLQEMKYQELMGRVNALHERRAGGGFTGGGRAGSG
jgi:hypothetical protein